MIAQITIPAEALNEVVLAPSRYVSVQETQMLIWLAKHAPVGDIIEIGCNEGETTRHLALACPTRTVYALEALLVNLHEEQANTRPRHNTVNRYARHLSNVRTFCDSVPTDANPSFIFIDGDHRPDAVRRDTETSLEWLKNRHGIIAWHDYRDEPDWNGVKAIVDELAETQRRVFHVTGTDLAIMEI